MRVRVGVCVCGGGTLCTSKVSHTVRGTSGMGKQPGERTPLTSRRSIRRGLRLPCTFYRWGGATTCGAHLGGAWARAGRAATLIRRQGSSASSPQRLFCIALPRGLHCRAIERPKKLYRRVPALAPLLLRAREAPGPEPGGASRRPTLIRRRGSSAPSPSNLKALL